MSPCYQLAGKTGQIYAVHCTGLLAADQAAWLSCTDDSSLGYDNRTVTVRVPNNDVQAVRVEHRVAGADASLHLVIAGMLAGIQQLYTRQSDTRHLVYSRDGNQ